MRGKKAKALRKIAFREAPHKNELIENVMKRYDEKENIIDRVTYRYNKLSPIATYRRIKKLYKNTPKNKRSGLLNANMQNVPTRGSLYILQYDF